MEDKRLYEILNGTEEMAKLLVDTIIEDYGIRDFLQCIFYDFNKEDRERFLSTVLERAGAI